MEATPEQQAEGMAVVRVLAAVLDRLVTANAPMAQADGQVTKFHALKPPSIGILQYLERIHKYASCSTECFILALIYIDRLIQRNNFLLTHLNVHRVVISSVLVAAKFFDDAYYNNAYYAKVGGVLVSELNSLEVEFLFRINFALHVTPELYSKYNAELMSHAVSAPLMEAMPRSEMIPSRCSPTVAPVGATTCVGPIVTQERPLVGVDHVALMHPNATPAVTANACVGGLPHMCHQDAYGCSQQAQVMSHVPSESCLTNVATVQQHFQQEHQRVISPSPRTSPSRLHQPHTQVMQVPHEQHIDHHARRASTGQICSVSNLAMQLQQQHILQATPPAQYPPSATSTTVSLSDTEEYDQYHHHNLPVVGQDVLNRSGLTDHGNVGVLVAQAQGMVGAGTNSNGYHTSYIGPGPSHVEKPYAVPQHHIESLYVTGHGMA